jgi:hypothetical protein
MELERGLVRQKEEPLLYFTKEQVNEYSPLEAAYHFQFYLRILFVSFLSSTYLLMETY